jgi:hypothetical protein
MKLFFTLCLLGFVSPGVSGDEVLLPPSLPSERVAAYAERVGPAFRDTFVAASRIDVKKGIGEFEAYVLSAAYLYAYIERCSSIHGLMDKGAFWVAETRVGNPPGDRGPAIYVEKATGITYSPEHKKVVDPKVYLQFD